MAVVCGGADPCGVAGAADRPRRPRRPAGDRRPVSGGDERPVSYRALRGQPENCHCFALCLRAYGGCDSIFPPQLPSGRGTRFGQVGLCPNRQPKIPGSRTRGQQDLHAECPYGSGRTKTPPQPQHGRCRRQRRRQNEVLRQTEFVSSQHELYRAGPEGRAAAGYGESPEKQGLRYQGHRPYRTISERRKDRSFRWCRSRQATATTRLFTCGTTTMCSGL